MRVKCVRESAGGVFLKKSDLRRVMCTAAAAVFLLALCCAAPAAAVAPSPDAVQFGGGTFATAAELADALGNGNASVSGDTLTLRKDINVTGTIIITGDMTILGGGHTIWRSSTSGFLINVTSGTLTLGDGASGLTTDCQGNSGNTCGSILVIGQNSKLVMTNGVDLTNTDISFVTDNQNNIFASGRGGAVVVADSATFLMKGGNITGNKMQRGAVNLHDNATFIMSGGTISGNTATATLTNGGGGVHVEGSGTFRTSTFTMYGGTISGNYANNGGGIYNNGILIVSGGTISGNNAYSGAALYYENSNADVTISNVRFTTNRGKVSLVRFEKAQNATIDNCTIMDNEGTNSIVGFITVTQAIITGAATLIKNNTGSDVVQIQKDVTAVSFTGGTVTGNHVTSGSPVIWIRGTTTKITLSGPVTIDSDQIFKIQRSSSSILPITIDKPYTGTLTSLALYKDSGKDNPLSGLKDKTIFTVNPEAGSASDVLPHLGLAGTTWTLAADDTAQTIIGANSPKPVALSGADNVTVTWINATIANVSIRLDPGAGDATDAYVKLGDQISPIRSGTISKGSTIKDLQVTGLTPGETYTVTAYLKNTGISTNGVFSYPDILTGVQAPTPATVTIIYADGTETGGAANLPYSGNATFGVLVKDVNGNLLKNEPVTWATADDSNTHLSLSEETATTVKVTGMSATGTDQPKLTATPLHGSVTGQVTITVSDADIRDISVNLTAVTVATGTVVPIAINATDTAGKNRNGEQITWEYDQTNLTLTGGATSGTVAAFTTSTPGTYIATAKLDADQTKTATVTITVVDKPTIVTHPQSADYTKGQTATELNVTATKPDGGTGTLAYQWQKSTDQTTYTDVGTGATTYTPDISSAGTTYYRVNVTYTESGITTWTHSNVATITVSDPVVDNITLTPADTTVTIQTGDTTTITAKAMNTTLNQELTDAQITWAVESGTSASIEQTGKTVTITGTAAGTTVITATSGSITEHVTVSVTDPAVITHTITAGAGTGGSITPNGVTVVPAGTDQTFTITPGSGYTIADVKVDGTSVGTPGSYTFPRVSRDHTITATFTSTPGPAPGPSGESSSNMNNAFRVLFDTKGGSFISPSTGLSYGDTLIAPPAPVKDGCTFGGWYTDSACTQEWNFSDGIPGDMTLYAKWTPVPGDQNSSQQNGTTTRPATKATTAPQQTQTPAASPTTAAPVSTPADTGVSPTLTQAPAPLCGALAGLLAAGLLLRRKE